MIDPKLITIKHEIVAKHVQAQKAYQRLLELKGEDDDSLNALDALSEASGYIDGLQFVLRLLEEYHGHPSNH